VRSGSKRRGPAERSGHLLHPPPLPSRPVIFEGRGAAEGTIARLRCGPSDATRGLSRTLSQQRLRLGLAALFWPLGGGHSARFPDTEGRLQMTLQPIRDEERV